MMSALVTDGLLSQGALDAFPPETSKPISDEPTAILPGGERSFVGMTAREALTAASEDGFDVVFEGSGLVARERMRRPDEGAPVMHLTLEERR